MRRVVCIVILLLGCSADSEEEPWVPGPGDDPPDEQNMDEGGGGGGGSSMEGCDPGLGDCDGQAQNGCETDLSRDNNCGECGRVCELDHADAMCAGAGQCAVRECDSGYADCDDQPDSGCERNLASADNGCDTAEGMSRDISGDTGNESTEATQGTTSRWTRVRVTENNNWWTDLSARITLEVPDGIDYDLIVWDGCTGEELASLQTAAMGEDESACIRWGDTYTVSNSRDLAIEVRFRDGSSCQPWSLSAVGNAGCE